MPAVAVRVNVEHSMGSWHRRTLSRRCWKLQLLRRENDESVELELYAHCTSVERHTVLRKCPSRFTFGSRKARASPSSSTVNQNKRNKEGRKGRRNQVTTHLQIQHNVFAATIGLQEISSSSVKRFDDSGTCVHRKLSVINRSQTWEWDEGLSSAATTTLASLRKWFLATIDSCTHDPRNSN